VFLKGPGTAELQVGMGGPVTWEIVDAIDASSEETGAKSDDKHLHTAKGAKSERLKESDVPSSKTRTKRKKKNAKGMKNITSA